MFLDLSDVPSNNNKPNFDPLPEGEYEVKVATAMVKDAPNNTHTTLAVDFVIQSPQKHSGRHIFKDFHITHANEKVKEIALEQIKSMLQCAGWKSYKIQSPNELTLVHVNIVTKHREYNGKTYTEIRYFKAPSPIAGPTETKNDLSDIPF
jgi:hypothetical protein